MKRIRFFTLTELVVGYALIGMLIACGWGMIMFQGKMHARTQREIKKIEQQRATYNSLKRLITSTNGFTPTFYTIHNSQNSTDLVLQFRNGVSRLTPFSGSPLGRLVVDNQSLVLYTWPKPLLQPVRKDDAKTPIAHKEIIMEHVKACSFSFCNRSGDWVSSWPKTHELPLLVRITLRSDQDEEDISYVFPVGTAVCKIPLG